MTLRERRPWRQIVSFSIRWWRVLLIHRKLEPCSGKLALPRGFVKIGETVKSACRREVREEPGIDVANLAGEAEIATKQGEQRYRCAVRD